MVTFIHSILRGLFALEPYDMFVFVGGDGVATTRLGVLIAFGLVGFICGALVLAVVGGRARGGFFASMGGGPLESIKRCLGAAEIEGELVGGGFLRMDAVLFQSSENSDMDTDQEDDTAWVLADDVGDFVVGLDDDDFGTLLLLELDLLLLMLLLLLLLLPLLMFVSVSCFFFVVVVLFTISFWSL